MTEKDLPRLNETLDKLYEAIAILCEIDGTLEITNVLADGTNALERRVIAILNFCE
jgi:hypothetical protein